MSTFRVPHAELAVEFSDEGGHPVVQLHGLTSSRSRDRSSGLDLGRGLRGARLLRYDARGHGGSSGRAVADDYRWPVLADDLLRLLDVWFAGERVHGVGASMGAATLLHAAVLDRDRFSGLTLVVPPTAWHTRAVKANDYRRAAEFVDMHGLDAYVEASGVLPPVPATVGRPATVPDVPEHLLPAVYRGAALSDLPSLPDLARIAVPTTVLAWTDDPAHPLSTACALADALDASMHVAATPREFDDWPTRLRDDVARQV